MLPSRKEIINAMQNCTNLPSVLQGYGTYDGILGRPLYFQGGFALVFPLLCGNHKIAFKIWYNDVEYVSERMDCLADFFNKNQLPFIVNTQFYKNGFNVNGNHIDALVVQWVNGLNIKEYIKKVLDDNVADNVKETQLKTLASKLYDVFNEMHKYNISHGDLQHTNIMVDESNSIKLIDYDSFYIPQMGLSKKVTDGYMAYQHPLFKSLAYTNEKSDYFSELIIYISIIAFAEDLQLWRNIKTEDNEYILTFDSSDYDDIDNSKLFKHIRSLSPQLKDLCDILRIYLNTQDLNKLQPFEDLLKHNCKVGKRFCIICGRELEPDEKYCIMCGTKRID